MSLTRWEPLGEINHMRRELSHLFEKFSHRLDSDLDLFTTVPPIELKETADQIHLKLELPGMEAKDLDIQVGPQMVSISGDRKTESTSEQQGVTRSEFRYGHFERSIGLPARIETGKVHAEFKHGVLELILPKAEEEKNKVVKVNLDS